MKLTYTNVNGYLFPNLIYKSGNQMEQLGKYGFLRRDSVKNKLDSLFFAQLFVTLRNGDLYEEPPQFPVPGDAFAG